MAITVKIPLCTYEVYGKIRAAYILHAPWALRNDIYDAPSETAIFVFEDSRYITHHLEPFIMAAPLDLEAINQSLDQVDEPLALIAAEL